MIRILAFFLVAISLTACGSLPQPFRGTAKVTRDNPLMDMPGALGVEVLPVSGLAPELSDRLTRAIADQLLELEIPAEPVPRAGGLGYILMGRANASVTAGGGTQFDVLWTLRTRRGVEMSRFNQTVQVPEEGPVAAAQQTAAQLAYAMGVSDAPTIAAADKAKAATKPSLPSVSVKPVEGAPGDGRESLRLAVMQALSDVGYRRDDVNPDINLLGTFTAERNDYASQKVTITWHAVTRDGREFAQFGLENVIPNGALDGVWGPTAFGIAAQAVNGEGDNLVQRLSQWPGP